MGEDPLKTRAAILWEVGADWSVEDIELDDPKAGEVKVKLAASGPVSYTHLTLPTILRV